MNKINYYLNDSGFSMVDWIDEENSKKLIKALKEKGWKHFGVAHDDKLNQDIYFINGKEIFRK